MKAIREFKFRAWSGGIMVHFTLFNIRPTEEGMRRTESPMHFVPKGAPIMQFTGLKDKNGKDIYEGDVLISPERDGKFKVVFQLGSFHAERLGTKREPYTSPLFFSHYEIIGNIYEHPELAMPCH